MKTQVPPGSYVKLELGLVREGKFLAEINDEITQQAAKMRKRIAQGDQSVTATIAIKLKLKPDDKIEGLIVLEPSVDGRISPIKSADHVRMAPNGTLLCQPGGSSADDPDQIKLFYDRNGTIEGRLNTATGEVCDPEDVAGKVGDHVG